MKKALTAIVVLGGIVGAVAYKLKKEQLEKELLEKELDMLSGEDTCECDCDCKCDCEEECECTCECEKEGNCEETCDCSSNNENPITDEIGEDYKKQLDEQSDHVIENLVNENDQIEEERPIQHFIDFKTEEEMETFKKSVIEKGYVVTRGTNPLQVSVLHIAPINRGELLANVYYLANQAIKYHGSYQGWQSRKVL